MKDKERSYINRFRSAAVAAKMPSNKLATLMVLAHFAKSETGVAWPSKKTIGEHLQIKERAVADTIAKLVDDGWLKIEKRGSGYSGRAGAPNVYRLVIPEGQPLVDVKDNFEVDFESPDVDDEHDF